MAKSNGGGLNLKARLSVDEAIANAKRLKAELKGLGVALASNSNNGGSANFVAAQGRMTKAMRESLAETQRLIQEGVRLRNEYEAGRISAQQLAAQTRILNEQRRNEAAALRAARQVQVAANGSYHEAQTRLRQLGLQIRSVEGGFSNLGRVQQARIAEYNRLNSSLLEFDRRMGNHQRNIGNYQSALNGLGGVMAGLVTTYLSAGSVLATFNQAMKSDAVRSSLEFTFGSVELADAKLQELLKTANRLGVNYDALTSSYKSFTGAVIASNFDFKEGERIFNAVAGASARLKLSSEDTEGALRALQQMISKGNVQAEELRGQLGERIPGAFSIAARAMGVTETQLNKMLQKGEVLAADLLPKLAVELEKTFSTENTARVEGLSAAWQRLLNVFTGTVGQSTSISRFFAKIVSGAGDAASAIAKIFSSSSSGELIARLFENDNGAKADLIKSFEDSFRGNDRRANRVLSSTGGIDQKADAKRITLALEEVTMAYNDAQKAYADYSAKVGKTGGIYRSYLQGAENDLALLKGRMEALRKIAPTGTGAKVEETTAQRHAREKAEREMKSAIDGRNALQAKIDELTKKRVDKQLSADDQELESVQDKYAKMRQAAIDFAKDPKNKGLKVDAGGLVRAESNELDSVRDKQSAANLKISLDEQKKLYDDFESYKDKVGTEKAKERYAGQLNTDRTYLEELQRQRDDITDPQKSKGGSEVDIKASEARLKLLDKEIATEKLAQQKKQDEILAQFVSYADERKRLTEQYQRDLELIGDNPGSRDKRTKAYEADLKELDFANLKQLESYEKLFDGIDKLSTKSALKQVERARGMLDKDILSGTITDPAEIAKIKAYFNQVEQTIREGSGKALQDLGSELANVASAVGEVNEAFGKMLGVVANVVSKVGEIKSGVKAFSKAKDEGDGLGQLTAGLGIFSAGIGIFSSIFKLFDRSAQREEQAAYVRDLQNKQTEALNKALERQVALLDDAYGTERIEKYSAAIKQAQENEAKYRGELAGRLQLTGDKALDKYITELNTTGKIADTAFFGTKFIDQLRAKVPGLPTDLESLQRLLDEGKLDASTSTIVQNLIQANKVAQELANNLRAENVGAGLSTIVDEFFSALEEGGTSLEDTLQKSIRRGLLQGLKGELTQKYIQDFYSQLDSALKDGKISTEEDQQLKDLYAAAEAYGKSKLDYINQIAPDPSGASQSSSLAKNITQITSDQASALEGITRGTFDQTKTIAQNTALLIPIGKNIGGVYNVAKANFDVMVKVETNTANTVVELQNAVAQLKEINGNTKQGTGRGSGLVI